MLRKSTAGVDDDQVEVIAPEELAAPTPVLPPRDVASRDPALTHPVDLPPPPHSTASNLVRTPTE